MSGYDCRCATCEQMDKKIGLVVRLREAVNDFGWPLMVLFSCCFAAGLAFLVFLGSIATDEFGFTHVYQPNWGWCCRIPQKWCRSAQVCTKQAGGDPRSACLQWETREICDATCDRWEKHEGSNGESCGP